MGAFSALEPAGSAAALSSDSYIAEKLRAKPKQGVFFVFRTM